MNKQSSLVWEEKVITRFLCYRDNWNSPKIVKERKIIADKKIPSFWEFWTKNQLQFDWEHYFLFIQLTWTWRERHFLANSMKKKKKLFFAESSSDKVFIWAFLCFFQKRKRKSPKEMSYRELSSQSLYLFFHKNVISDTTVQTKKQLLFKITQ